MINPITQLKRQIRAPIKRYDNRQHIRRITHAQFASAGITPPPLKIRSSDEPTTPTDVILRKENRGITALINQRWRWQYLIETTNKIAAYAYWFSLTADRIKEILVDASDGNHPTAAHYKFSITSSLYTPLPDAHFFRDYGYAATDAFAAQHAPAWDDRMDSIVWRGRLNGDGLFSMDPAVVNNPGVIQRLRMALKCQDADVDFRFIADRTRPYHRLFEDAGLIGGFIPTHDWGGMKYAIDIDGYTNAWCNFMQRLKLGCCVLKVESQFGYYQWYYHKLIPWEHFVPIRADLSDLNEQIDWVRSNSTKARDIAANGQALAQSLTFESECQIAVAAIEARE